MSSESTASARALASRRNGAKSRGPRTVAGKARSARNAVKHGLCAKKIVVLPEEDAAAFRALEAALIAELAPQGALQSVLAQRIVSAAWRLARADRMEAEVLEFRRIEGNDDLGLALIRDGNGTRGVDTLLRYRGAAMAEFIRALRTLRALQAEAHALAGAELRAAPPARRRARCSVAKRHESGNPRHENTVAAEPVAEAPQNAPDRKHLAADPGPLAASARETKRTQESTRKQELDVESPPPWLAPHRSPGPLPFRAEIGKQPGMAPFGR